MGAGRYCMGRAPNSNVLYMIVHGWGTLMQVSGGIGRLVQNSSIVKSEPKLPHLWRISNMCFLILKFFLFFCRSLGFYGGLTYCFSQSRQLDCVHHLSMHFTPQIHTLQGAVLLVLCCQEMSCMAQRCRVCRYPISCPWAQAQIDIPKRYHKLTFLSVTVCTHVCTYIARIDPSFKALH